MSDLEDAHPADLIGDEVFVQRYMYHGWLSRRPFAQLILALGFVAFFVGIGAWTYVDLAEWEASGEPETEIWVLHYPLYKLGGKLLIFWVHAALGLFLAWATLRGYAADRAVARRARKGISSVDLEG